MKKVSLSYFVIGIALYTLSGCSSKHAEKADYTWLKYAIETSAAQLEYTVSEIGDSVLLPRSIWTGYDVNSLCQQLEKKQLIGKDSARLKPIHDNLGSRRYCFSIYDWTSGFFPGNLWYAYQLTGNEEFKKEAVKFTNYLYPLREYKGTHDIGFMMNCSFGNSYRLCPVDSVRQALIQTADNLCGRFNPEIGCIRSWDFGKWNFPVIIDNMMNLELLFEATKLSGDSTFYNVAKKHADTTMANHFRADNSCYHVVDYDPETGEVRKKQTAQGYADESSWARGQAWALYGYTMCYRYTHDAKYLAQAEKVYNFIFGNKNLPEDLVPYWDFDAPKIPNEPRDASAAACTASALYELSTYVTDKGYKETADRIMESLASPAYRAEVGTNGNFILMHSVGSIPHGAEIDVPLNYADYYFLEALKRKRDLEK